MEASSNRLQNRLANKLKVLRCRYLDSFVFIHINKTGGSSIEKVLSLPFEHKTALEKMNELGRRKWEKRVKFTVIRNPWDKVVSHYYYRVQTNQTNLNENHLGFRDWVLLTYGGKDTFYFDKPKMFMPQSEWISDEEGKILVDYICRFENLAEDFNALCAKVGKKNSDLPHLKASKRGHYRDYYDADTIRVVGEWFRKDIENFGYQF